MDGDTVQVSLIELHYGVMLSRKYVRLTGVRAPERDTEEGRRATEKLRELLARGGEDGVFLSVPTDREIDRYNRLLGILYIRTEDGALENVNRHMQEYLR